MDEPRCFYDEKDNVIFLNLANYRDNSGSTEIVMQDLSGILRQLPEKPYLAINFEGIKLGAEELEQYTRGAEATKNYFKGVVRFGLSDAPSRLKLRVESLKHELIAGFYATKEEALVAIRQSKV
jgi:hypothetical protein